MSKGHERLAEMAAMIFDARSATLRAENQKRDEVLRQIAALVPGQATGPEIWPGNALAAFAYERWAVERRAVLNGQLAAQKVACLQAEAAARLAFGRSAVLQKLIQP